MKKIVILVFVIILTLGLSGCGNKEKSSAEKKIDYLSEIQNED